MMSIAAMGVGSEAADYCIGSTREDYYTSGGDPLGLWCGAGVAALGIGGVSLSVVERSMASFTQTSPGTILGRWGHRIPP